jgi:hypothetical protein
MIVKIQTKFFRQENLHSDLKLTPVMVATYLYVYFDYSLKRLD